MARASGTASAAASGRRRSREGDHQGRAQRVLHLHDRRDRDDPQRLVQADAVASKAQTVPFKIQYRYRPQRVRRPARADVPADERRGVEARHDAAAGRRRARLPRQRPRRALVPDAAADQVHPDRRQDRAEPGRRSGSDLRADQAPRLPRRPLAADQRHQRLPQDRRRRRVQGTRTPRSSAGTTTRSSRSGSATTRASRSTSKSAARFPGHVVFRSQLEPKLHDYQTVEFTPRSPPARRPICSSRSSASRARNAKQNNVTLETAEVKP